MFASLSRASKALSLVRRPRIADLMSMLPRHATSTPSMISTPVKIHSPSLSQFTSLSSSVVGDRPSLWDPLSILIPSSEPVSSNRLFDEVWKEMEKRDEPLVFPREIIWLNGAPGSGKSANSKFITKLRGFTHEEPIVMSKILLENRPEAQELVAKGKLVGDKTVIEALLLELVKPKYRNGALVDGYPRTSYQASILPLLRDKMYSMYEGGLLNAPLPRFSICILNVGREESLRRQLLRGKRARQHNEMVRQSKTGDLVEERSTDFDEGLIRKRYEIYVKHRDALQSLHRRFHSTIIDAEQPLMKVQHNIRREYEILDDVDSTVVNSYLHDALVRSLNATAGSDCYPKLLQSVHA